MLCPKFTKFALIDKKMHKLAKLKIKIIVKILIFQKMSLPLQRFWQNGELSSVG